MQLSNPITVSSYNPEWPKQYAQEVVRLRPAFGDHLIQCYHVGSTSVPDLAAKPNIDIIAEVNDLHFDLHPLEALGYEYKGPFNLPNHKGFSYRSPGLNVNLHVFPKSDPEIKLNLLFRDALRGDSALKEAYAALKYTIIADKTAQEKQGMYRGYTLRKQDFIHRVLRQAGFTDLRFVFAVHPNEWAAVHDFWTKEEKKATPPISKDHKHFILYQGTIIVGYAHVHIKDDGVMEKTICLKNDAPNQARQKFDHFIETWCSN